MQTCPICKEELENITNAKIFDSQTGTPPRKIEINVYSKMNSNPYDANLYLCNNCKKFIAIAKK